SDTATHLSRNHGACARTGGQGHSRSGYVRAGRGAVSAAQRAEPQDTCYACRTRCVGFEERSEPMKSGLSGIVAIVVVLLLIVVGYSSIFTVRQTEQALVVRLGAPVGAPITEPGLHFKAPFIDTVISIDNRILDLENPAQEIIASDQKRLVVDAFARYRIKDPLRFYQSV